MENENIISKGFYGFPQVKDFISVKNHMFLREDGKVYLALRFSNDTEYTFDYLSFYIVELNAEGKAIGRVFAECADISFAPGSIFAPKNAFAVSPGCADFRVEFCEAFSGAYKYTVRKGRVAVFYGKRKAGVICKRSTADVRVKQRKAGKPLLAAFLAFLSLAVMAACMARYIYKNLEEADKANGGFVISQYDDIYEEAGVIYAEI